MFDRHKRRRGLPRRLRPSSALLITLVLPLLAATASGFLSCSADKDDDDEDQAAPGSGAQASTTWTFDSDTAGRAPSGFAFARTGRGRMGRWVVRAEPDAPSGSKVLAQEDSDRTDYRFPVAVADGPAFGDVSLSVRCKPVSGHVDQGCGIVWRYQDENNYYLTRANALEDNVCWYYVQNGRRIEVKRVRVPVASGVWHSLRADMRGDHVEVYFNDKKLIDVHDSRFTAPGKVGVWTKADSHILFDNLTATPLVP